MKRILLALALFASSPVFAATEPVITGGLPRSLSSGSFSLKVEIKDVSEADKLKGDADETLDPVALFKKRLYVKLPAIDSAALPVSLEEASIAGSEKKVYVEQESATVDPVGTTYTYTFNIRIVEVEAGILAAKAKENGNKLAITVEFYLADTKITEKVSQQLAQESYVINAAPALTSIVGTNGALRISWTVDTSVAIKGGTGEKAPSQVQVYLVDRAQTTSTDLPGRKFEPSNAEGDPVDSCSFADPGTGSGACVTCPDGVYLDADAIKANPPPGFAFDTETNATGFTQIAGLDNEKQYLVFLQYEPDGLQVSQCLGGQPSPDLSLTEANGEDEAEIVDFRCFIATAAYGSPLHKDLVVFRRFRDEVLMTNAAGRAAVGVYYKWSPGVARYITAHPRLRSFVRSGLEVVAEVLR